MISLPSLRRFSVAALIGSISVACGGGKDDTSCGIIGPTRTLTSNPTTLAVDVGRTTTANVTFTSSCSSDSPTITVASNNAAIATVTLVGGTATVTGVGAGTTTLTLSAAGPTTTSVSVTVRPLVPTTLTLTPASDTLSPLGTRQLTSAVQDQNGAALTTATVVWRSLTTAVASVSASGLVTAAANGTATIQARVATGTGTDSLTASTTIQVVAPCTRLRPIGFAATYSGRFDASSCRNFLGFTGVLDQFTLTAAAQTYYSVRMAPSFVGSLVPLTVGSAFFGIPPTDTAVTNFVVIRPGTFGFIVASTTQNPGTYTITTALNPDPRQSCVGTDVTRGVSFVTGLTPTCQARNIRVLPLLNNTARIIATATSPSFPVRIDLLEFGTNTTLATASATINGGTATLNYLSTADRFVYFRIFGPPSANDNVTITVDQ
ncbi:MAG: Ig-like domain-containing protein [Gemmatimonadaceae bacterium]|nr:Ig-like domain-containing protein [Gemmatimonadaceae bacterium]